MESRRSLDYLVGADKQRERESDAERLGSFEPVQVTLAGASAGTPVLPGEATCAATFALSLS